MEAATRVPIPAFPLIGGVILRKLYGFSVLPFPLCKRRILVLHQVAMKTKLFKLEKNLKQQLAHSKSSINIGNNFPVLLLLFSSTTLFFSWTKKITIIPKLNCYNSIENIFTAKKNLSINTIGRQLFLLMTS